MESNDQKEYHASGYGHKLKTQLKRAITANAQGSHETRRPNDASCGGRSECPGSVSRPRDEVAQLASDRRAVQQDTVVRLGGSGLVRTDGEHLPLLGACERSPGDVVPPGQLPVRLGLSESLPSLPPVVVTHKGAGNEQTMAEQPARRQPEA